MHKNLFRLAIHQTLSAFVLLLAVSVISPPAQAQNTDARLKRIENEIQTLSRAVFKGEAPPPGSVAVGDNVSPTTAANTELRLQQIEIGLRELTGKLEERNYETQQFQTSTGEAMAALEARIVALEAQLATGAAPQTTAPAYPPYGAGGVSSGLGPDGATDGDLTQAPSYETGAVSPDEALPADESFMGQLGTLQAPQDAPAGEAAYPPAPALPVNDPVGLYEQAFSYLRDKNYDQAEVVFTDFLGRYPEHDLAPNAKYWLGESYYVRNDFERAARIFAESYQKYPKGPKGPDNLLKLGMSLAGLGKSEDACLTYGQLQKEYPNGSMPVLMRAEQEMEKLGCQQF